MRFLLKIDWAIIQVWYDEPPPSCCCTLIRYHSRMLNRISTGNIQGAVGGFYPAETVCGVNMDHWTEDWWSLAAGFRAVKQWRSETLCEDYVFFWAASNECMNEWVNEWLFTLAFQNKSQEMNVFMLNLILHKKWAKNIKTQPVQIPSGAKWWRGRCFVLFQSLLTSCPVLAGVLAAPALRPYPSISLHIQRNELQTTDGDEYWMGERHGGRRDEVSSG